MCHVVLGKEPPHDHHNSGQRAKIADTYFASLLPGRWSSPAQLPAANTTSNSRTLKRQFPKPAILPLSENYSIRKSWARVFGPESRPTRERKRGGVIRRSSADRIIDRGSSASAHQNYRTRGADSPNGETRRLGNRRHRRMQLIISIQLDNPRSIRIAEVSAELYKLTTKSSRRYGRDVGGNPYSAL